MLAGVAVVLALAAMFVPLLGLPIVFVWPSPIVLLFARRGPRTAILATVVVLALVGLISGLSGALFVLTFGPLALVLGWSAHRRRSAEETLALASLAALFSFFVELAAARYLFNLDLLGEYRRLMQEALDRTAALSGLPEGDQTLRLLQQQLDILHLLYPAILILAAALLALLMFLSTKAVVARLDVELADLVPFKDWQLPMWTLWAYLVATGILLLAGNAEGSLLHSLGLNAVVALSVVFMVQGMSFLYFLLLRWRMAKGLAVVLLVVLFMNPIFSRLLAMAGIFEVAFGYRQRLREKGNSAP